MRFATRAIRVAQDPEGPHLPVIQPLYQTSTFAWEDLSECPKFDYTRVNNPNRSALEEVIAALEGGRHALCFSSGMAAVAAALSFLQAGDHVLMATDIYGGTFRLVYDVLSKAGISCSDYHSSDPDSIDALAGPNTKAVIFESPSNPNLRVSDIRANVAAATKRGLVTIFDNTFASPALQRPLELGVTVVVHSTTKYIGGHSDIIGGALITNDENLYEQAAFWLKSVGAVPSPFDCWLALRGVKTIAVRMRQHCENALKVAEFLAAHTAVSKVYYPGLASHPDHVIAKTQMSGFGGMVTFEVAGTEAHARQVAESTRMFILAESLGGVESLLCYPKMMSHAGMTEEERVSRGIPPTQIRLSVGIEDVEDLIDDLAKALQRVPTAVHA